MSFLLILGISGWILNILFYVIFWKIIDKEEFDINHLGGECILHILVLIPFLFIIGYLFACALFELNIGDDE